MFWVAFAFTFNILYLIVSLCNLILIKAVLNNQIRQFLTNPGSSEPAHGVSTELVLSITQSRCGKVSERTARSFLPLLPASLNFLPLSSVRLRDPVSCRRNKRTALTYFGVCGSDAFWTYHWFQFLFFLLIYTEHTENHHSGKLSLFVFVCLCFAFSFVRNLKSINFTKFIQIEGNWNETRNWHCGQFPRAGYSPNDRGHSLPNQWSQSWRRGEKWSRKKQATSLDFLPPRVSGQVKAALSAFPQILRY